MSSVEQIITIELFGQNYSFKTASDAQEAQKIVDLLVAEVVKVQAEESSKSAGMSKLAVLIGAALNITNQHFDLKRKYSDLLDHVSRRSTHILRALDALSE